MNKKDKRSVMSALGEMKLSAEGTQKFIIKLAQNQMFKSPRAFENFCVDCAIFYISNKFVLMRLIKSGLADEEMLKWADDFIEHFYDLKNKITFQ